MAPDSDQRLAAVALALVFFTSFALADDAEPQDRVTRAMELHAEGPAKAAEIIALLEAELAENPAHDQALELLGIVYFGIGEFEEALARFDEAIAITEERDAIVPQLFYAKAGALYQLGRLEESRQILEAHQGRWQDNEQLKELAETLRSTVTEMLQRGKAAARKAEGLMDPYRLRKVQSDNFLVTSDAFDPEMAKKLALNLEVLFSVLDRWWGEHRPAPEDDPGQIQVFLFTSQGNFLALAASLGNPADLSLAGFYAPDVKLLAFHTDVDFIEEVMKVMFHESVHAYMHQRVASDGVAFPQWLHEGLAEYVANSRFRKGKLQLGIFCGKTFYRTGAAAAMGPSFAKIQSGDLRRAAKKDPALLDLDAWFETSGDGAGFSIKGLHYAKAWMLVTYLRDGKPEWRTSSFPQFVLAVAGGATAREALERHYDEAWDELNAGFREHVKVFRTAQCR